MIKKITIRIDVNDEQHRRAIEILKSRNRSKYKSQADYIVPAIIEFKQQSGYDGAMQLSEQDKQQIIREVLQGLDRKKESRHEPGI